RCPSGRAGSLLTSDPGRPDEPSADEPAELPASPPDRAVGAAAGFLASPLVDALATIASTSAAFRNFCEPSTPIVCAICCSSGISLDPSVVLSIDSMSAKPLP